MIRLIIVPSLHYLTTLFCLIVYSSYSLFSKKSSENWGFDISLHIFAAVLYYLLSRKAEGNGPMKPWQPVSSQTRQGANSISPRARQISQTKAFLIFEQDTAKLFWLPEEFFFAPMMGKSISSCQHSFLIRSSFEKHFLFPQGLKKTSAKIKIHWEHSLRPNGRSCWLTWRSAWPYQRLGWGLIKNAAKSKIYEWLNR